MQYIPLIMVLLASLVTLIISLYQKLNVIFSLKILVIVIILFYIIGNIVKVVLSKIIDMDKVVCEDKAEDERADEQNNTSDKSGDDFEE